MYNKVGSLKLFQVLAGKLVQNQNCALKTQTSLSAIGRRTVMFYYFLLYLIILKGHSILLLSCNQLLNNFQKNVQMQFLLTDICKQEQRSRHERDKEFVENNLDVH